MSLNEISKIRLTNQLVAWPDARQLLLYMGAMQAQDFNMCKWAVGIRMPDATDKIVEDAINCGDIIRTHLLRPTWHLVARDDVWWMLSLTAPHIKASMVSRHKQLELDEIILKKVRKGLEKYLAYHVVATREELVNGFLKMGVTNEDNRASHVLMLAELDGLICSGKIINRLPSYTLLENLVPKPASVPRDEALYKLASKYFTSHGPATSADFAWWSGLPAKDVRTAIGAIGKNFLSETIDDQIYYFPDYPLEPVVSNPVYLLPAYDEMIISYKDRSAMMSKDISNIAVSANGMFWPVILAEGKVRGLWKRTVKNDSVLMELRFFTGFSDKIRDYTEEAAEAFGRFLSKKIHSEYQILTA